MIAVRKLHRGVFVLALAVSAAAAQPGDAVLQSPDGRIAIAFSTAGRLTYSVSFQGKSLIEPSGLSLELVGQPPLGTEVRLVDATRSSTDETFRLVAGKTSVVRNHFNALRLELEETAGSRLLAIEARAYDDSVAFRYVVPEQTHLQEFNLTKEKTEFRLAKDATTYSLLLPNYRSMYESEFIKLPISAFSNRGGVKSEVMAGLPMLLDVPGVAWAAIAEADLRGYSAMYLTNPSGRWTGHWFESRLAPQVENPELSVTGSLPHHSAWRVVLIGTEPGQLIESNVIASLNPEPVIKDTSWIHAGKAAWDWWGGFRGPDGKAARTTAMEKYYVDFAAKSGLEYMLVDGGWTARGDITKMNGSVDVPEVVRYAKSKGVQVWVWAGYEDVDRQMDEAFALYEKWGVVGVKTDFIERDDQRGIEFYYRCAQKAAEHHLMMDYHGASKPWGMERTYPNVVGYEAVLGMEQSKAGARDNPDHRVTLPFTRMLVGQMDYTPGGFNNVTREEFEPVMEQPMVMGTRAQQLAMYVVYDAPFQMVSDWPGAYEGEPEFEFIKRVPSTWDETRVIDGVPGEYVTIARRRGEEWFLGAMTGWQGRALEIPLDFLGQGRYTAEIYADGADADTHPKSVAIEKRTVDGTMPLSEVLAPGGGYAVRFVPVKAAASPSSGPKNGLGAKPFMGWSSWSLCASKIPGYGDTWLNEEHVKAMSDAMEKKLQPYGYTYVNIDGGWHKGFDAHGLPLADPARFPHGIRSVADYVHAKGQKIGLHYIAGLYEEVYDANPEIEGTKYHAQDIAYKPLTRTTGWKKHYAIDWSHPAAQAYIDSIAREFAAWGVDFLKVDGVTPDIPQTPDASPTDNRGDVAAWSAALIKTGRPIWFSLSWYLNPALGSYWRQYANSVRANGDVEWAGHNQLVSWTDPYFGLRARWLDTTQTRPNWHNGPERTMEQWLPYIGNGMWADMDSLDVGVGTMDGLTEAARQSYMSLWVILSSPLYSGDDLTKLDDFGLSLLTNREAIAINQAGLVPQAKDAAGKNPVWWSKNADGSLNVAIFNLNDSPADAVLRFGDLGFHGAAKIRDIWAKSDLGAFTDSYKVRLGTHACQLLRVAPAR